jgi:Domain of unknown function (DUF4192)
MTTFDPCHFPLDRPGKLIAALPAVLGFVPEKSFVLLTVEHGALGCVMRADLTEDSGDAVFQMAAVAAASRPERAVAVIVDEDGASCRMCNDDHRELARVVAEALERHGIELQAAHVVDRITAGGRWHCADGCGDSGVIEDPSSSPLAVAAVLEGRRLYANRDELLDVITANDPTRTAGLIEAIERTSHDGARRPESAARRDVEHAMAAAADLAEGRLVTDDDVARLACALTDPRVRDTLYALAVGSTGDQVEALWALLSRVLPDPWRAEALVLLAFSAYVRGDGPMAGVSLEAALRVNGNHKMAGMLDQALQSGMRPEQIRELARTGYRLAKRIGVRLPPKRIFGRRAG